MGFLSGILGTRNDTQVRTPTNNFQAQSPASSTTLSSAQSQATGGAGPAAGTIARQNLLNDQLTAAAAGQGPNPALEQLKQTTSQNINNAAGSAASARGINPALAAKLAVNAGSTANQTAAGQAATMSAQQQIAARAQLGQNLGATAGAQLGQQEAGTALLGTAGGLDLGAQGLNERVAGQNAGLDLGAQQLQAGIAGQNASMNAGLVGGLINGGGAALSMLADGGPVPDLSSLPGGPLHDYLDTVHAPPSMDTGAGLEGAETPTNLPAAAAGNGVKAAGAGVKSFGDSVSQAGQDGMAAFKSLTARPVYGAIYARGGSIHSQVPVAVSPGEKVVPPGASPSKAAEVARSGPAVPGRAQVSGDSPANDTVHARLPVGAIVLPRSVVNSKNPGKAASSFVASVLKRGGGRYAGGGKVSPGAAAQLEAIDFSEGGVVGHHPPEPQSKGAEKPRTGRGVARDRMRGRMTRSDKPQYREAD